VRVDGQNTVIGGTSAVAPLWAGFIARVNAAKGSPVGYLNPLLYKNANVAGAFRDIAQGSNGDFAAAPGWDACTGLGSPGRNLSSVLMAAQAAA
jgi:kumamolisin